MFSIFCWLSFSSKWFLISKSLDPSLFCKTAINVIAMYCLVLQYFVRSCLTYKEDNFSNKSSEQILHEVFIFSVVVFIASLPLSDIGNFKWFFPMIMWYSVCMCNFLRWMVVIFHWSKLDWLAVYSKRQCKRYTSQGQVQIFCSIQARGSASAFCWERKKREWNWWGFKYSICRVLWPHS